MFTVALHATEQLQAAAKTFDPGRAQITSLHTARTHARNKTHSGSTLEKIKTKPLHATSQGHIVRRGLCFVSGLFLLCFVQFCFVPSQLTFSNSSRQNRALTTRTTININHDANFTFNCKTSRVQPARGFLLLPRFAPYAAPGAALNIGANFNSGFLCSKKQHQFSPLRFPVLHCARGLCV